MKTTKIYISKLTLLLVLATAISINAHAGTLITGSLEGNTSSAKTRPEPMGTAVGNTGNVTPEPKRAKSSLKISCWQNGELIFEQPVIAPKDKVTDIRQLHNPAKDMDVLALDFKNAFCMIK